MFGFTEDIDTHKVRNLLFKIILYAIFRCWCKGIDDIEYYENYNCVWYTVLSDINIWNNILNVSR